MNKLLPSSVLTLFSTMVLASLTLTAHAQASVAATATATAEMSPQSQEKQAIEPTDKLDKALADDSLWVILGGISRHSCRDCGFRESNPGLALQWSPKWLKEYTDSNDWRFAAGTYINSNDRHSVYAGVQWLPIDYGVVKAGLQAAVITNYLHKSVLPTLLPTISVETKHVGADIFLVPKFPSVSSAVLLSFKVRY